MFRTIWTKSLRDYRVAILGWGLGLSLLLLSVFSTARDVLAINYNQIAQSFRFLADTTELNTINGYITFRSLSVALPVALSIWMLLAGARLLRGDEERGALDVLLSSPRSRWRILLEKVLALLIALLLIVLLLSLGTTLGQVTAKISIDYGRALLVALNAGLLAFFFSMVALLFSQFLHWRSAAAGWTGGLLALAFLLDGTGRTADQVSWLRYLSPLYYYNLNKPLITDNPLHLWAALLLAGASLLLIAASGLLFAYRDLGSVALLFKQRIQTARSLDLARLLNKTRRKLAVRAISLRALRAQRSASLWWIVAMAFFAAWITILIPTLLKPLQTLFSGNSAVARLFGGHDLATNAGILASLVFAFLPVFCALFALSLALPWGHDLDNGGLELVLSTPRSRARVLLERFLAVLAPSLVAPLAIWLAILAGARIADISVDNGNLAAASFSLIPLELLTGALVYSLAGLLRYGAVLGLVSLFVALSYLLEFLRNALKLPAWVMNLSIFHLYGSPVTDGMSWGPFLGMTAIALILLALGAVQFSRHDLAQA